MSRAYEFGGTLIKFKTMKERMMAKGEVKWFNNAKGWGFIIPEGGGTEDIFVHFSSIAGTGYKTLMPGQIVSYDVTKGDRGLHASNVVALTELPEERAD